MHTNRLLSWIGILGLSLMASACLNNNTDCVPSGNCTTLPPTSAGLTLSITNDAENVAVPVAVYLGNVSDSVLYFVDTINTSTTYDVALDQRYGATAKYRRGNVTIIAIDGDKTSLSTTNDCGDVCYNVTNATLKLKLKN